MVIVEIIIKTRSYCLIGFLVSGGDHHETVQSEFIEIINLGIRDVCMLWFWLFTLELEIYKRYIYEDLFSLEPS